MTTLTGRIRQAPEEKRRYTIDYTSQLATGETITGIVVNVTPIQQPPLGAPALVVDGIVILPTAVGAVFFVSGGSDGISYEIQFLGTSSLTQVFEDIVEVDVLEKM